MITQVILIGTSLDLSIHSPRRRRVAASKSATLSGEVTRTDKNATTKIETVVILFNAGWHSRSVQECTTKLVKDAIGALIVVVGRRRSRGRCPSVFGARSRCRCARRHLRTGLRGCCILVRNDGTSAIGIARDHARTTGFVPKIRHVAMTQSQDGTIDGSRPDGAFAVHFGILTIPKGE